MADAKKLFDSLKEISDELLKSLDGHGPALGPWLARSIFLDREQALIESDILMEFRNFLNIYYEHIHSRNIAAQFDAEQARIQIVENVENPDSSAHYRDIISAFVRIAEEGGDVASVDATIPEDGGAAIVGAAIAAPDLIGDHPDPDPIGFSFCICC